MGESEQGEYVPLAGLYEGADADVRASIVRRDDLDRPRSARTTEALFIAFMPAAALIADVTFLLVFGGVVGVFAVIVVTVLATVFSIGFARNDQTRLAELGHVARTRPYLALLPALYLFVRGHRAYRETFDGMGIAWISLGVLIAVCYSALVVVPMALTIGGLLQQSMNSIGQ